MNTTARIETTGRRNKIHISGDTADLLIEAKKEHWIELREDVVVAKGKGALQTYWLVQDPDAKSGGNDGSNTEQNSLPLNSAPGAVSKEDLEREALSAKKKAASTKVQRLIDWNYELLLQLLKKIVARRSALKRKFAASIERGKVRELESELGSGSDGKMTLDEVAEIITLPTFDIRAAQQEVDPKSIDIGDDVASQLHDFVDILASMYRDNPFHCFEHASHVTMSVSKLLSRISAPDSVTADKAKKGDEENLASALHDHTYGITSDPLTQFSVVLSALIHDVDHRGVPNTVLCKEEPSLGAAYKEKSVAEQNSVDIAWNSLMDPCFAELRRCIYGDVAEMKRFRKLLVNSVMATDIMDKELGAARKKRWENAFQKTEGSEEGSEIDDVNRKATIVIEHLIQASDVSHTMQHWHVYQKWNARLFEEMYTAFRLGRTDTDPSIGWYKGEMGFFDFYIIPLTKKLKECGVFGVSSDEYLNYATENRREWEAKGFDIVNSLVEKYKDMDLPEAPMKASFDVPSTLR